MRIALVGAGIGGLAAAQFMLRVGIDVMVYEQAPALGEVGAGIQVGPNAVRLLHRLGLAERLQKTAVLPEYAWEFRRWKDGEVLFRQPLGQIAEERFGAPYYVVHRADLLDALAADFPEERLRLGYRCTEVEAAGDQVNLSFDNGVEVGADAVIGADGIRSKIRESVVPPVPPRFSGLAAYPGPVPIRDTPLAGQSPRFTIWAGPHK